MKIFICEFITGGGMCSQDLPEGLVLEGDLMLNSLIADLLDAGVNELTITRDSRLETIDKPVRQLIAQDNIWQQWQKAMNDNDYAIIVAPEHEQFLYKLTKMAEQSSCRLLGCSSKAVKLTSSKSKTYEMLTRESIPCVPTWPINSNIDYKSDAWIAKPDDGVGGVGVRYFDNISNLDKFISESIHNDNYIIQPYIKGIPGSLSLLCTREHAILIGCNRQYFVINKSQGVLKSIDVNGLIDNREMLSEIANQIFNAIPGLWGFVGVDFILADNGPYVLEINPRLTTSYVGLNHSLNYNPMNWLLALAQDERLPNAYTVEYSTIHLSLDQ